MDSIENLKPVLSVLYDVYSKSPMPPDRKQLKGYYEDLGGKYLRQTLKF